MPPTPFCPADAWWMSALSSPGMRAGLLAMSLAGLALLLCVRALRRLPALPVLAGAQGPAALHRDQRATATVEFVLVFPIVLFISLLLIQTTFLVTGNFFVHYAAYAATRSAIVQIPSSNEQEAVNEVFDSPGHPKREAIRRAAVLAVLPAAGRLENGYDASQIVAGVKAHYDAYGRPQPKWIDALLTQQLAYADANTDIQVLATEIITPSGQPPVVNFIASPDATVTFGPRDPVTVRVLHRLSLNVPYVSMLYADDTHTAATGTGRYTNTQAQYTLTNEGVIDALPPTPTLPRTP